MSYIPAVIIFSVFLSVAAVVQAGVKSGIPDKVKVSVTM